MKKTVSLIITGLMLISQISSVIAFAETDGPILHYDFENGAQDVSENALHGTLENGCEVNGGRVYFDGTDDYVQMPEGVVSECDDITVSMYVKPQISGKNQFTWTFGNNSTQYMFLGTCNGGSKIKCEITTSSWNGAQTMNSSPELAMDVWHHVVFTIEGNTATIYVNGEVLESRNVTLKPSDLGKTTRNYLGKSQYSDPYFKGYISDFRVYDYAIGKEMIDEIGNECRSEIEGMKYLEDLPSFTRTNRVTEDIELPLWGSESGERFTWISSDESIIANDGTVTRPAYGEGRKNVTLTGKIGNVTKDYTFTVLPETTDEEYGYLLAYFTGNNPDQERMSYALSRNGYDFYALNSSDPVFKPEGGTLCMRDPYIFKGEDGKFYCIATDMKSSLGWSSQWTIFTWESTDLVHWTNERIIDFRQFEGFENCTRAWAPQAVWCPEKGAYMIYLALYTGGKNIMYRCYTEDFATCTAPEVMFEASTNAIDADILKSPVDGRYYMYYKGERIHMLSAETLSGEWTDTDPVTGEKYADLPDGGVSVEGSAAYKLIGENIWHNLVDCYNNGKFICLKSTDMINFDIMKYSRNQDEADYYLDTYDYGKTPRHGSVIVLSRDEYEYIEDTLGGVIGEEQIEPVAYYSFDNDTAEDTSGNDNHGILKNGAAFGEGRTGRALSLDGVDDYVQLPYGLNMGIKDITIASWVKLNKGNANQRIIDIGVNTNKYMFLSPYFGSNAKFSITTGGTGSQRSVQAGSAARMDEWTHFAAVLKDNRAELYINGELVGYNDEAIVDPNDIGWTMNNFIGKSNFSADPYFGGLIDEVRIYNRALTNAEIGNLAECDGTGIVGVHGENIKKFNVIIDKENKTVQIPVTPGHITSVEPVFEFTNEGTVYEPEGAIDLTEAVEYTVTDAYGNEAVWTITGVEWGNSVLGEYGLFGDPNIVIVDGKYYIYPTTDGTDGWRSTYFKTFSSEDLVHWKDEGVILDLKDVAWSTGVHGWAPTMTERNGKYYFYYSSGSTLTGSKDLGVAVSDSPTGPFVDIGEPLVKGGSMSGQMIDSQVFIDDDGTPYLFWGNGRLYVAQLNEDMISFASDIKDITPSNFTEGIFVIKRHGKYYYTWSEGNTEQANYKVRYGVADSPMERPSGNTIILTQDKTTDKRIQCTAHHSIINIPDTDDWYICYHRFNIPTTVEVGSGRYAGSHREVAIDKMEFDENGNIIPVTATLEGITEKVYFEHYATGTIGDYKSLKKGDKVEVNVTVQNNNTDEDVVLIYAIYHKDGHCISAETKDVVMAPFKGENIKDEITLPENGEDIIIQVFTWSSVSKMKPVGDVIE
ncbi:MAG: family 43 glycosylhydrolase [Clostridia bacterium]|nr:family 43 glycosylhydrolase [Clostridia bacterium]